MPPTTKGTSSNLQVRVRAQQSWVGGAEDPRFHPGLTFSSDGSPRMTFSAEQDHRLQPPGGGDRPPSEQEGASTQDSVRAKAPEHLGVPGREKDEACQFLKSFVLKNNVTREPFLGKWMHFGVILPLQLQVHLGQVTIQRRLCLKSTSFYQPSPDVTLSPPSSQCDKRCTGTATVSLRAHYPGHGLPHQGVHFMKLYKRNSL